MPRCLKTKAMHSSSTRRSRDNQLSYFSALAPHVSAMKASTLVTASVQDVQALVVLRFTERLQQVNPLKTC